MFSFIYYRTNVYAAVFYNAIIRSTYVSWLPQLRTARILLELSLHAVVDCN